MLKKKLTIALAGITVLSTIITTGFTNRQTKNGGISKFQQQGSCSASGQKSSSGSQVGWTNSVPDGPGSCSTGNGCHSGGSVTPVFHFTGTPAFTGNTYVPGTTYTIAIQVTGYPKYGFDLELLDGNGASGAAIGTFTALTHCQIKPAGSYPKSITQTSSILSTTTATFTWVAPASGSVYVYGDGNGVNGDGGTGGDKAVLYTLVLTPQACAGPAVPGAISGNTTVCSGSSNTYTITPVSGATSYTWTLPVGWTGSSTTNSITAVSGSSNGNITVTANNSCGSSAPQTSAITVNSVPAIPGLVTGNTTICPASSNTYSIAAVSGATSYTWTLPGGWTGSSATNSISATAGSTGGNITVTSNNTCGSSAVRTAAIIVNSIPAVPAAIIGNTTVCSSSSNTYSVAAVSGASSYTWTLPGGWTGSSATNSITALSGSTGGNITVTANNTCGSSAAQTANIAISGGTAPAQPGTISGNAALCSGTSNIYSVTAVAGASSYTWTVPGGWTGTSATNSITTSAGNAGGNITVIANNACGSSSAQTLNVIVNNTPSTPSSISGNSAVCSGSANTYSVASVSGASSYSWILPSGWTGSSATNSIAATANTTGGNITVTANNSCGPSSQQTANITVNSLPAVPAAIIGSSTVCSGSSNVYSIAAVPGASTYTWAVPSGWTGSSTTNSITATAGTTDGVLTVTANNSCGISAAQTKSILIGSGPALSQPGPISGNLMACSGTSTAYSILPVAGANNYTWTLPSGWSGSSTSNSITAVAGSTNGNITVSANNSCGSSIVQTLNVSANSVPPAPASIMGSTAVCAGSMNTYTIALVPGASSYSWTLPAGWMGSSFSNSATASGSQGGIITVTASNACGTSSPQTAIITVSTVNRSVTVSGATLTAFSATDAHQWVNCSGFTPIAGQTNQTFTADVNGNYAVIVSRNGCIDTSACINMNLAGITENSFGSSLVFYPNPSEGKFIIEMDESNIGNGMIEIYNLFGEKILQTAIVNAKSEIDLRQQPGGIYLVKIETSKGRAVKKVIKK